MSSAVKRRHVNDFEARRAVAQQPQRARRVAAGQDEPVAAGRQAVDEVVQHPAQARKAFEGAELEELVEQERRRLAAAGARAVEERQRRVEGRARAGGGGSPAANGDVLRDRAQEPLGRGRRALDVDVLRRRAADAIAQLLQQRGPAAAASAEQDRNARRRSVERRERRGA